MSRRTGRRPRAETAELIRRSAVHLLQERGLQGFANSVRLDDALALLEAEQGIRLTHGSIYGRIWIDQRDFQLDVVATTIADYNGAEIAEAISAGEMGAGDSPDQVMAAAFARAAAAARCSRRWNLWLGARTAVVSTPEQDDDERLAAALAAARAQVIETIAVALDDLSGPATGDKGPSAIDDKRSTTFLTLLIGASLDDDPVEADRLLGRLTPGGGSRR